MVYFMDPKISEDNIDTLWQTYKKLWKDPPCSMGKSTISMAMLPCSIAMLNYVKLPEGNS